MIHKMNTKKVKIILLDMIAAVCVCIAGFTGYKLYYEKRIYKEGAEEYSRLSELMNDVHGSSDSEDKEKIKRSAFAKLKKENPDFAGWIYLEDSSIDYPIVHTDNNDFYLNHLFSRQYNKSGCVFIDMDNQGDFSDRNTILYAHNMKNGTMFHDVVKYENQEFYDTHKVIHIDSMTESYNLYPVAGIYTTGYTDYLQTYFEDNDKFMDYVQFFIDHSSFNSEQTIGENDQIVLLSTCAYNVTEGRYALIGKLSKE